MTSWTSSLQTFIHHLREYAEVNNIDNSKFPKAPQAISNRLRKVKANLLEGLGIEVIVERITSGKDNKKLMNTAILKIRKRSPAPPVPPVSESDGGKSNTLTGGDLGNTILISSEAMGSPVNNNGISAQSFSETINIGDTGNTGDTGDTGESFPKFFGRLVVKIVHHCPQKKIQFHVIIVILQVIQRRKLKDIQ